MNRVRSAGPRADVVTVFLARGAEILLLRRSAEVSTYRGRWAGVSGYLETDDPADQAWTELGEELGIGRDQAILEIAGDPLEVPDPAAGRLWVVHPFRFRLLPGAEPRLDREHVEMRWSAPEKILESETVPGLWEAWCRVEGEVETILRRIAGDRQSGATALARLGIEALLALSEALPEDAALAAPRVIDLLDRLDRVRPVLGAIGAQAALVVAEAKGRVAAGQGWAEALRGSALAARERLDRSDREIAAVVVREVGGGGVIVTCSHSDTVRVALIALAPDLVRIGQGHPLGDGVRAAGAIAGAGIPVEVVADNALPAAVAGARAVLIGADQVLADGSVVNRSGSFALALAAERVRVPFLVACQAIKLSGQSEAASEDAAGLLGPLPDRVIGRAPVFDVVPASLVSRILTEAGSRTPSEAGEAGLRIAAVRRDLLSRS